MSHDRDTAQASRRDWLWLALVPLGLFVGLIGAMLAVPLPWQMHLEWVPSLDAGLDWYVDALSAQFLVLITGIGTMVFIYASGYMAHGSGSGRFYTVLLMFMVAMIGAVSADHMLVLFLCWELTSLTSFFLVGFKHTDEHARASARQAMFITLGGGLALLAALILLAQIAGTWSLQAIAAAGPMLVEDPRLPAALILLFIGCFTKSAQFPFHFWLPNAMTAPTPASAYLHSATMVKLGIYLLARLDPAFNNLLLWEVSLIGIGTITAVWAALLALRERDLKRILARSTVSALGTLVLLIGLPNEQAALAVIAFLFAHALYKAPLFFVAGNIDHATGTRSIDHLMGLRRHMPFYYSGSGDSRPVHGGAAAVIRLRGQGCCHGCEVGHGSAGGRKLRAVVRQWSRRGGGGGGRDPGFLGAQGNRINFYEFSSSYEFPVWTWLQI